MQIRCATFAEVAAGLLVTVVYLWIALHAGHMLERVADLWLAACGVWIVFFLSALFQALPETPRRSRRWPLPAELVASATTGRSGC